MHCRCDEAKLIGYPTRTVKSLLEPLQPKPRWSQAHDCSYIAQRNALIPEAERIATMSTPGGANYRDRWAREFLAAMDDLSRRLRAS